MTTHATILRQLPPSRTVPSAPPSWWGKDHWSTFAYLATCCHGREGRVDFDRMRVNAARHPGMLGHVKVMLGLALGTGRDDAGNPLPFEYPTRLRGHHTLAPVTLDEHDDVDCLEDCAAVGLLLDGLTGMGNGVVELTALGERVWGELRLWKQDAAHTFATFAPSEALLHTLERGRGGDFGGTSALVDGAAAGGAGPVGGG